MQKSENTKPTKIIKSSRNIGEYNREIWQYKNLILIFAIHEFKVQYIQTRFGFLWVLFRPIMVLALFTFVFDRLIHIPGLKYPYTIFAFSGLIVWNNFSYMVNNAGSAIISNQQLIKKNYFPRIILIFSKMLVGLVEVLVSIMLLLLLIVFLRYPLHWQIIFLPVFILFGLICGTSIAIWLNILTIRYRDLNHFVPILIGYLIWLTPVFYPVSLIPQNYSFILYFNPIAGVIQGCRWAILADSFPSLFFLPSFIFSFLLLLLGFLIFIRSEYDLADYI